MEDIMVNGNMSNFKNTILGVGDIEMAITIDRKVTGHRMTSQNDGL